MSLHSQSSSDSASDDESEWCTDPELAENGPFHFDVRVEDAQDVIRAENWQAMQRNPRIYRDIKFNQGRQGIDHDGHLDRSRKHEYLRGREVHFKATTLRKIALPSTTARTTSQADDAVIDLAAIKTRALEAIHFLDDADQQIVEQYSHLVRG